MPSSHSHGLLALAWYGMLQYGIVWYGVVLYGMLQYGMVWYGMVWYGMLQYGMVWYGHWSVLAEQPQAALNPRQEFSPASSSGLTRDFSFSSAVL